MSRVGNLPQSSADLLPESVDRFDQALAGWFARHQGAWSGTATELIAAVKIAAVKSGADAGNDLWPQSGRAFFSHLESHRQTLRSLGVDVSPHAAFPRMVLLRPCQEEKPVTPSGPLAINYAPELQTSSHPVADHQNNIHAISDAASAALKSTPGVPEHVANGRDATHRHADGDSSGSHIFENIAAALLSVVEMQDQIRAQGLDLQSTMDLVASRTQDLIGSSGVAIGLLEEDTLLYPVRLGIAVTMTGLPSQAKLFHSCISKGAVLLLPDAQRDPAVGAGCRREGVRSLIVLPILNHREVAGAMELLFKGRRSFSTGEVMTLELIADLVGGRLAGMSRIDTTQPEAHECPAGLRITGDIEPQLEPAALVQAQLSFSQYTNSDTASGTILNLESSIPGTVAALAAAPVPCKRVWWKLP
jgi:GAF domain-containing protein